jgi:spermidine/putrescine transport system permease protein
MSKYTQAALKRSERAFTAAVPALLWQALFFYLPLLIVMLSSIMHYTDKFEGFTLEKIGFFLSPIYFKVIGSSLLLAFSNAILCLFIGFPLAYILAFKMERYKNLFLFLLMIPFWTNFLLHVYAWFYVLEKGGILNSFLSAFGLIKNPSSYMNGPFAIMIMMVYYYLPFFILPLYSSLERFDKRLFEASFDLGASWMLTFRKILLPLVKNGLRSGFFLVFIPSFGEFAIPELMGGDKIMFAGSVISHFILGDQTGSLGAAFALVSCLILLTVSSILYKLFDFLLSSKVNL